MKAFIYENYGNPNVLKLVDTPIGTPKPDEVLVKVYATTVTSGDVRLRASDFPAVYWLPARIVFGLFKPKSQVLGNEFAGVVIDKGKNVTRFNIDDRVYGTTTMLRSGAHAEYVCVPDTWKHGVIDIMPTGLTFYQAAALPIGAMTALCLLEKCNLAQGQTLLIYGASGSVGSYAIQLAKSRGVLVTAVCSGKNVSMVTALGADKVIDYTLENFTQTGDKYDVVFDAVGKIPKPKDSIKQGGRFITVKTMTSENAAYMSEIKRLVESGQLTPFIDSQFEFEQLIEAHKLVDSGRKRGNVVIRVVEDS